MIQTVGTSASNRLSIINTAQPAASRNTLPFDQYWASSLTCLDCARHPIIGCTILTTSSSSSSSSSTTNTNQDSSSLPTSGWCWWIVVFVTHTIIRLHQHQPPSSSIIADDVFILLHQPQAVSITLFVSSAMLDWLAMVLVEDNELLVVGWCWRS